MDTRVPLRYEFFSRDNAATTNTAIVHEKNTDCESR